MTESPWSLFVATLKSEMTSTSLTSKELAARLRVNYPHITEETVSNWRRGRSRPDLNLLGPIVDALNVERRTPAGEEPFSLIVLLQKMGVLPDHDIDADLFDRSYRLLKLQLKQQDAEDAFSELGRRSGAARVVQAAVTSADWAVAVWPAYGGPNATYRLHVADRLDIRRIHTASTPIDEAVWADPAMKSALRGTNAMPSTQLRDRWTTEKQPDVSTWAISHVTSPREPVVSSRWEGLRGLALVATTRKSWVNEVASLVGFGLGYGLVTTSQLAMTAIGNRPSETRITSQYEVHQRLIKEPPHRRVWSHWGMPPGMAKGPFGVYRQDREEITPRFVFLDETDDLLGETVEGSNGRLSFDQLDKARLRLREAASAFPESRLLRLRTEAHGDDHDARWSQVFTQAADILKWLSADGEVVFAGRTLRQTHVHVTRREPAVAAPFLEWLRLEGEWPAKEPDPQPGAGSRSLED